MFKSIPGCVNIKINEHCDITTVDGSPLPKISNGKIDIVIYGKKVKVDVKKLMLLAMFEMYSPGKSCDELMSVDFVKVDCKVSKPFFGHVPVFTKPIKFKDYNVVPTHPQIAISKDGKNAIKWKCGKAVNIRLYDGYYAFVSARSPKRLKVVDTVYHRMVALANLPNDDIKNKTCVNHKNGNKHDYSTNNLEWVTVKENNEHALRTKLNKMSTPCKVKDYMTGKVSHYISITKAMEAISTGRQKDIDRILTLGPYKLFKNRYDIILDGESREWKAKSVFGSKRRAIEVKVFEKDKLILTFPTAMDFKAWYKLNPKRSSVKALVEDFHERNPDLRAEFRYLMRKASK